ncbi:MAG: hypothetical protein ACLT3Y_04420 [Ruminococcus callidus]
MNAVTCGVAEMTLDSGSLTVNRFECTGEDASSIFTLDSATLSVSAPNSGTATSRWTA